jgi:hypothetical protein
MRKSLIACLSLSLTLAVFGTACDDDGESSPTDAKTDTKLDGGDGGLGDGPKDTLGDGISPADGLADGPEGGLEVGAETSAETAPEVSSEAPPASLWTNCTAPKGVVSAADFCAQYGVACGFDPAGGTAMAERYKSAEDCVAKYNVGSGARKSCVVYHLCVASQDANTKVAHCPHPPQASLPVPVGPGPCGNM